MSGPVLVCFDGADVDETWRQCADVLYGSCPYRPAEVPVVAGRLLRRYPGCSLVVVRARGGGCVAVPRGGAAADVPAGAGRAGGEGLLAFAVDAYARLVEGDQGASGGGVRCLRRRASRSASGAATEV
ncbi:hypothetical protein [Streptomyces sp. NPDC059063]|uniref:hypothetical protein n=1 Tax=unclassified Streptomyces TaxID=2593676 RepID=UPI0036B79228